MDIAVRWVFQATSARGIAMEAGQKPTLCFKGRRHMLCVAAGHPVRVLKRPAADFDKLRQVMKGESEFYPVALAVEQFRSIAKKNGITMGASRLLEYAEQSLRNPGLTEPYNEDEFDNEEELTNMPAETPATTTEDTNQTDTAAPAAKENDVSKKKAAPKKSPAKKPAAAKAAKPPKAPKAPAATKSVEIKKGAPRLREGSTVHKAYEWWKEQLLKQDDPKNLDRGVRKEIIEKMNAKFEIKSGAGYYQYFTKHFGLPK